MSDNLGSYLGRFIPSPKTTPSELTDMAKRAWHRNHVLTVFMNDKTIIIDDIHRQALENVGNMIYGSRVKK